MRPLILAALLILTACGADGPPLAPGPAPEPDTGITVTGEIAVGLSTRGH